MPDSRTTVVVITMDRCAELLRTLRMLRDLPERPLVIVTDNGSGDCSAARRNCWPPTCCGVAGG